MAKIISMFNHKGGVSKTTSAYHIGWMLSKLGKKVILVDTDSQCNLTNIAMGDENFENYFAEEKPNIKTALSPAFEAKPFLIEAFPCIEIRNNPNLLLIPGSFELSEYEVSLGMSLSLSDAIGTLKNLPGSLYRLLETTANRYEADYVLIDLNPSLSAFNEVLLASSDYFIIPSSPDKFSIMAIKSLTKMLPMWETWAIKARLLLASADYPLPNKKPKFLGTIMQRFNIRYGNPTVASQTVIDDFNAIVKNLLIPSLASKEMLLDNYDFINDYCLGSIPDFQTLNALYQKHGIPVFDIPDNLMGTGVIQENYIRNKNIFYDLYNTIANIIITES